MAHLQVVEYCLIDWTRIRVRMSLEQVVVVRARQMCQASRDLWDSDYTSSHQNKRQRTKKLP